MLLQTRPLSRDWKAPNCLCSECYIVWHQVRSSRKWGGFLSSTTKRHCSGLKCGRSIQRLFFCFFCNGRWCNKRKARREKKKITSNMFILFSKARENNCTAKDWEGGQVEVSHLQQASWVMGSIFHSTSYTTGLKCSDSECWATIAFALHICLFYCGRWPAT